MYAKRLGTRKDDQRRAPGGLPYPRNLRPGSAEKPPSRSRLQPWPTSPQAEVDGGAELRGRARGLDAGLQGLCRWRESARLGWSLHRAAPCAAAIPPLLGGGGSGADSLRVTCGSEPARCASAGAPSYPTPLGPLGSARNPGGGETLGRGWVGRLQPVGFGLLDWRPDASLSGASCSLWSWTGCL